LVLSVYQGGGCATFLSGPFFFIDLKPAWAGKDNQKSRGEAKNCRKIGVYRTVKIGQAPLEWGKKVVLLKTLEPRGIWRCKLLVKNKPPSFQGSRKGISGYLTLSVGWAGGWSVKHKSRKKKKTLKRYGVVQADQSEFVAGKRD